jgi:hypothetical protein
VAHKQAFCGKGLSGVSGRLCIFGGFDWQSVCDDPRQEVCSCSSHVMLMLMPATCVDNWTLLAAAQVVVCAGCVRPVCPGMSSNMSPQRALLSDGALVSVGNGTT